MQPTGLNLREGQSGPSRGEARFRRSLPWRSGRVRPAPFADGGPTSMPFRAIRVKKSRKRSSWRIGGKGDLRLKHLPVVHPPPQASPKPSSAPAEVGSSRRWRCPDRGLRARKRATRSRSTRRRRSAVLIVGAGSPHAGGFCVSAVTVASAGETACLTHGSHEGTVFDNSKTCDPTSLERRVSCFWPPWGQGRRQRPFPQTVRCQRRPHLHPSESVNPI